MAESVVTLSNIYSKTSKLWSGGLKYFADVTTHSLPSHERTKKFQIPVQYIPFSKRTLNNWSLCLCFTTCNEHFCGRRTGERLKISSAAHTLCVFFSHTRSATGEESARQNRTWWKRCAVNESLSFIFNVSCSGVCFTCVEVVVSNRVGFALYQSSGRDSLASFLSASPQICQHVFELRQLEFSASWCWTSAL